MKTKKLLSTLLLAVCMQCVIFLLPQKAYAADITPVTPNETFYGTLETSDTQHYYSFKVDKTGYFNVEFSPVDFAADVKHGWTIELCYADTGNSFYEEDTITSSTTLPVFNFKQGTEVYIAVSAKNRWSDAYVPTGHMYAINVKTVEDKSWEQEGNNTSKDATLINSDETWHGNLYCKEDVDYYEYTIKHNGYFNVNFSLKDITADVKHGWEIDLCYGDTTESFYSTEVKTNTMLPVFNFKKGTKLYIAISAENNDSNIYVPLWQEYILDIEASEDKSWEQESNNVSADATLISTGKQYSGNLYYKKDVDYYKYTVENNGYFNIKFSPEDITADVKYGWRIDLYNGDTGSVIYSANIKTNTTLPDFNLKKGMNLYIAISAEGNETDIYVPLWQKYSINIKATDAPDWEQETLINGDGAWSVRNKNSTSIALGKKYYGNMCTEDDNDLFKFSLNKTGYAIIKFDPDDVEDNLGSGYRVNILTKSGKIASKNDVKSVTDIKTYLKKGTYYIEVTRNYNCPLLKKYMVSVTNRAEMPSKVSALKKKGTDLSWKKTKKADGYEIVYSKKSNFKKAQRITTDTNSYRLYGLEQKKTYYVKVRSYKNTGDGLKVYSAWSNIIKVRI